MNDCLVVFDGTLYIVIYQEDIETMKDEIEEIFESDLTEDKAFKLAKELNGEI